jgi:hypothetical protein
MLLAKVCVASNVSDASPSILILFPQLVASSLPLATGAGVPVTVVSPVAASGALVEVVIVAGAGEGIGPFLLILSCEQDRVFFGMESGTSRNSLFGAMACKISSMRV